MIGKQAKKIIGLALTLAMTVSSYAAMPVTAESDNEEYSAMLMDTYGDFEYIVSNDEITITKYIGSDVDITIPSSINSMPVTTIGSYALEGFSSLKSIIIPDSVTAIGAAAFMDCSNLENIIIPDSVTIIGEYAFYGCSSLENIIIPDSVTTIENDVFWGCSKLVSITIPDSVTTIGNDAFYGCSKLAGIKIPNSVTSIGSWAFRECSGLKSITIPNSVTSIGIGVFQSCSGLTSITIPDSVTSIGEAAFYGCSGLTDITIPDSVTSIGRNAFYGCSGLTGITIPDSVTSIGEAAFSSCSGLTSITISASVKSINTNTFSYCSELKSIIIPAGVTSIGETAFYECSSLKSITIPASVTNIDYRTFNRCYLTDVYYTGTETEWNEIVILDGNDCLKRATKHYSDVIPTKTFAVYGDKFKLRADTSLTQPSLQAADDNKVEFFIIDGENEVSLGTADYIFNEDGVTGYAELEVTADKKFKIGENKIKTVYNGNANVEGCENISTIVNVEPKNLEYTVSAESRGFNASDIVTVTLTPTGLLDGDSVTLSGTGKISGSAAGTYDKVTVSDVTLSGADAAYYTADGGTFDCNVTISEVSKTLDDESITIDAIPDHTYTSKEIKPTVVVKDGDVVLKENEHYKVEYANNVNVGTADVIITGIGPYTGTKTVHFNIKKAALVLKVSVIFGDTLNLKATTNSADDEVVSFYSGNNLIGEAKVSDGVAKLNAVAGRDFAIGNNTVKAVCGDNAVELNSGGSDSMVVELSPKNISSAVLNDVEDFEYTGLEIKPEMTVTDNGEVLTADDYDVVYSNNTSVGTATVTVNGKGYYTGSKTVEFNITGDDINVIGNSGSIADITKTDDKLIIKCTDTSVPPLTLFRAVYDGKGALKDVVIIKGTVDGDVVTFDIPSGNAKYMLWTDNNNAVMNAMNI